MHDSELLSGFVGRAITSQPYISVELNSAICKVTKCCDTSQGSGTQLHDPLWVLGSTQERIQMQASTEFKLK